MRVATPFAYCFSALALVFALAGCSATGSDSSGATAEQRTARAMEVAKVNPLDLRAFLVNMPKGGDLHVHLEGAIYAETFIKDGAEDKLCVNISSLSFVKQASGAGASCKKGDVPAAQAFNDQHLYDALVDAFSMRGFVPTPGVTGHDHFFDCFPRFMSVDERHTGEWLDEVATRAAAQNEQYLELMVTPIWIKRSRCAGSASTAARRMSRPAATSRSGTSIKCCALFRRPKCSRRRCLDLRRARPIRESSASITCNPKTTMWPCPTTRCT